MVCCVVKNEVDRVPRQPQPAVDINWLHCCKWEKEDRCARDGARGHSSNQKEGHPQWHFQRDLPRGDCRGHQKHMVPHDGGAANEYAFIKTCWDVWGDEWSNSKRPSPALQPSLVLAAQPTMAQWSPSRRSSGVFMSTEEDSNFFKQLCNLYPYLTYCDWGLRSR